MKLRSTLLFAAASLSAAALAPVAVTTTAFFAGTQSAEAASLADAVLSIDAFTSTALTNLGTDGWEFTNISSADVSTGGVYTTSANQGAIGTGTSGASLTTNVPSGGDRYTWSAIFTVSKDAFESSLNGLLLSGMTSTAGSYTGNVGVGVNNGSITGAWEGGSWSNLSIADATTYADASNMITIGFTYGPKNNTGSELFVLNTDGTTTTIATNGNLKGSGEIVTAVLSNKSGVSYSNLYWFNSKLEEPDMTAAMSTVGNGYVWAGTSSANTWNTESTNTNWIKDGANVAFDSSSSVIFGNAAESKTVAIDSAVTAGTISVLDDYTFNVGASGSLSATAVAVAGTKTAMLNLASAMTLSANLGGAGTLKKTGTAALTYAGTISSGATLEIAEGGTISVGENGAGTLTDANVFSGTLNNGGTLNISGGVTNVTGSQKLNGNVVIASGATLYSATTDAVTWGDPAASQVLKVLGTLHLDARWSMGSGKKIVLSGGTITGTGGSHNGQTVSLDYFGSGTIATEVGAARSQISAHMRVKDTLTFDAAADLSVSGNILKTGDTANAKVVKQGAGTLTLSGENTYRSLEISAGKLVAASESALGTGAVTVNGTGSILDVNLSGTLTQGTSQALTTTNGGKITVSAGTLALAGAVNLSSAIEVASGASVTVSESTVFNLTQEGETTLIDGGTISGWDSLTLSNFTYNGAVLTGRSSVDVSTVGAVTYTSVAEADLVWNGGSAGTWNTETTNRNWTNNGASDAFYTGDNVTFSGDATVTVAEGGVVAGAVNITAGTVSFSGGTITAGGGVFVTGTSAENIATLKLTAADDFASGTVITVNEGGKFELNGKTENLGYNGISVVLNGGTLSNAVAVAENKRQLYGLTLTADSTVEVGGRFGLVGAGYAAVALDLGGHTLTKTGDAAFVLVNTTVKNGTLSVTEGSVTDSDNGANRGISLTQGAAITVSEAGSVNLKITSMEAGTSLTLAGTGDKSTITLSGSKSISGNLTIGNATVNVRQTDSLNYDASNTVTVNQGGVLDFGAYRWTVGSNNKIVLSGGTIQGTGDSNGALDFYRSATVEASEGTTSEISATVRIRNEVAGTKATFTVGSDAILTVSGTIKGAGALQKNGTGELVLSGTNTYTGGTTISAGTLVAAHASALGNGNVSIADGATLKRGVTGALNVGGTFTTEGAAKLVLGELNTTTAAIVAGGNVTLSSDTIFDLASLTDGGVLVAADNGSVTVDGGTFSAANFRLNGAELGSRTTIDVSNNGSNLTIASISQRVLNLTWAGGATDGGVNNVWKANTTGWTADGETNPEFQTGDNVTFGDASAGTVNVSGVVSVGTFTVNSSADYNFTGVAGTGAKISGASAFTKSGSGTATFTGIDFSDYSGAITINAGTLKIDFAEASATTLAGVISGAGTFEKTGAGVLTLSGNSNAGNSDDGKFTGTLEITAGMVKFGAASGVLGKTDLNGTGERYAAVVKTGGTLDINGQTEGGNNCYKLELAGGALVNNGASVGTNQRQITGLKLSADSTIGGTGDFGLIASGHAANTLELNGHTLTKTGTNSFYLVHTTVTEGTICIEEGKIEVATNNDTNTDAARFVIKTAGEFAMNNHTLSVASITTEGDGTINLGGGTLTLLGDSRIERITSAGTVVVSGGVTLTLKSGRFNSSAFTVNENAKVLLDNQYPNETLANVFSGAGSIEKTGAGTTTTLSGANTFTGGLTVTDGALVVTQDAALGGAANAISVAENGTLELGFGGDFARSVSGAGTLAKSGDAELILKQAQAETLSLDVKGGTLTADFADGSLNKLSAVAGATFKANQDIAFAQVENFSGTLTGAGTDTRISVAEGAFAGTVSGVSLVKTDAGKTLDMSGATFEDGGTLVVEAGTVENLTLSGDVRVEISGATADGVAFSGLVLDGGMLALSNLSADAALGALGLNTTASQSVIIEFRGLSIGTTYKLFTLGSAEQTLLEGWLDDASKLTSNLGALGEFSIDADGTLCFTQTESAGTLIWNAAAAAEDPLWTDDEGVENWVSSVDPWTESSFKISADLKFDSTHSLGADGTTMVIVDPRKELFANSFTVDVGENGSVVLYGYDLASGQVERSAKFSVTEGISIDSGTLVWRVGNGVYSDEFKIGVNGTLNVQRQEMLTIGETLTEATSDLTLRNKISGTGRILHEVGTTLTLSGDRSGFTGTLDVQAGTVVLGEQGAASDGVYRSTESATIRVGENGAVRVSGEILNNNDRVETLAKVTGEGKIIVNGGASLNNQRMVQFNIVDGGDFTGTVELVNAHITAADTLFASGAGALTASTFGNASRIVLKNSALNFTNRAATFAYDVEVSEDSQVRVYGANAGATISGDVYGAGTLTVTDDGKLILSGNVGTAAKTLVGLTLASGSLEIIGAEMNVARDVSLSGSSAVLAAGTAAIGGNLELNSAGTVTLGGELVVAGGLTRGGGDWTQANSDRILRIADDAAVTVTGAVRFANASKLEIGDNAQLTAASFAAAWGLIGDRDLRGSEVGLKIGTGSKMTLGEMNLSNGDGLARGGVIAGEGADVSVFSAGVISLTGSNLEYLFRDLRLELAGNTDGAGIILSSDTHKFMLQDVTLGIAEGSDGWSTGAALKLNGGTTTFETAEGKTITLNGAVSEAVETATGTEGDPDYVAATVSSLVKTGAGTLVLTQSNKNARGTTVSEGVLEYRLADASYVQGESAPDVPAGLTVADGATLKFTSTSTTDKTIELGGMGGAVSLNFDAGSTLVAGRNTTVALGAATLLAGDVTFSSETGGKLKVLSGYSEQQSAYISSLTLDGGSVKTSIEIDAGATLALSDLRIKGNYASEISGDGTLKLNGTVYVGNTVSNAISASALELTGDTVFSLAKDSRLTVSSDTVSAGGNTLTKAGDGRLIFGADSLQNFDGSFAIEAGTVAINDGGFLRVGGENSFSIASGTTLSGGLKLGVDNAADVFTSAVIGGSTVGGDVEIGNADLTFDGTLSGVARLDWNGPLTVTLSDEFRAAITAASGQMHLVGFSSGYVNGEAISSATDFGEIVDSNAFLGRDVEVVYTESGASKYIDVIVTGALLWNETVADWTQGTPISGYGDVDKWDVVVRDGTEEGAAAFEAGKFVQFTKSGSMTLLGTVDRAVTTNGTTRYYGNGVVNTAGMNFAVKNGDDDGTFILKARRDGQEKQQTSTIYGIGSDAVGYQDEGITISAGNIIFEEKIVNMLTGGLRIYGGSLQVSSADALGRGEYDVDSRTYATGEILLGSTTDRNASAKLVFQNVNQKTDVDAEDDFLDIEAAHTIHVGNKGAEISVIESLGVVKLTGDLLRADGALEARLTKSGAGTLEISRGRDVYADDPDKRLDSVRVAEGTLVLADTGDLPTSAWTVDSGATLSVDQGDGLLLGSVTLGGALAVGGQGEFRAVQIVSSSTGATISGTLVVSDATELADGSKGTVIDTSAGDVALTGSVNAAAGTTDGKLYKSGAGTLTLTAAPNEGATRGKFRLSADFVQSGGTVSFSNGVLASGTYEIGASSTVSVANAELSGDNVFEKGLKVAEGASVQFALGANTWKTNDAENRLVFNGEFSMEAGSSIAFTSAAGESVNKSRVREVLISDIDSGAVSFGEILRIEEGRLYGGQLRIGGLGDNGGAMGLVNLTVKADNFSAGIVSIGGLSSLKLSNETGGVMASAKAQVIYVESRASDLNAAVLDLSSGTRLEVGNDLGLTVLQGTGTLRVKGGVLSVDGYSDADGTPSILLDGADFNFSVVENAGQISSLKKISTTANGGNVRKSGAGTLALLDGSGDIAFSGGIRLDEGATHLYSRVKNADVTISDGASLRLYIDASAGGEGVEDAGFARGLSGAGTLEVAARFDAKGDLLAGFDGTIAAVTSSAVLGTAGRIIAYGDLADWQRNGPATRVVGLSGGFLVFAEAGVELKSVAVDGTGWILGDEDETAKIETVKGAAGSSLMLLGNGGTVGDVVFEESDQDAGENNRIGVGGFNYSAGTWRLEGTTTNVDDFLVTGYSELEVAGGNALGTAGVLLQGGGLTFSASGSFDNALTISQSLNAVRVIGGASVELSGQISKPDDGWTMFIAGVEADEEIGTTASAGTLKLSESVLGISGRTQFVANKDSVVSVSVAGADVDFGTASLSGSGTFEKTGAGTLTLNSADAGEIGTLKVSEGTLALGDELTLAASAGEGSAKRIVAVAGATLNVGKAALSGFTLTGEGDITITSASEGTRFTTIGGIADAGNVALSGRMNVSGTIFGSGVEFADAQASIAFTGAETGEIVTGTTLRGNTVTLVNAKDSDLSFSVGGAIFATKLVLEGKTGLTGGVVAAEFSGSLEKKGDGGWTVSNYTFGANAGESLEVQAGTLEWQHAKFGAYADDENNSMLVNGTLRIRGVDMGDTLGGTIEGSGMLEIAATRNLTLETEAGTGATWKLKISEDSDVTIATALPGALEVTGEGTRANLELADGDVMTMGVGKQLLVGKGSILEKSGEGTLELANTDAKAVSRIDGELSVTAGTVVQKSMTRWGNDAEIIIDGGTFSVDLSTDDGYNSAKLTGTGTFEVAATDEDGYSLSGDVSEFTGTVSVADGAKLVLGGTNSMLSGASEIRTAGTVAFTHTAGGELKRFTGDGTIEIDVSKNNGFPTARYSYSKDDNAGFDDGTLRVRSGVLSVNSDELDELLGNGQISVQVKNGSSAVYDDVLGGIRDGAFLRVVNGTGASEDVPDFGNALGAKSGVIFAGGTFRAGAGTLVSGGANSLFVTERGSTLSLGNGADVDGSLYVAADSNLILNEPDATTNASISVFAASSSSDGNSVSGNFTLNGTMTCYVTNENLSGALLNVGGISFVGTDGSGSARIELNLASDVSLANRDVVLLTNYQGTGNLDDILTVASGDVNYEISRDGNGNIVIVSAVNDYCAPSGLSGLYSAIKNGNGGANPLWNYLKSDRANASAMTKKLVALSPVSFGSLLEMQSGFASLENDLLRERLEQRRYERAVAGDGNVRFKPFVNVFGADREGDGDGTDAANYDVTHAGVLGGFDVAVSSNTIFGVSVGADWTKASLHDGAGKHEGDGSRLGIYGMSQFENAYFGYGLSAGGMSFDTKRNTGYNGETVRGETDGNDVNASFLLGAGWTIGGGVDIAPFVGLDVGYAHTKAFKETGGRETALSVESAERWSLRGKVGATLSWRASERLRVGVEATFAHEFLDTDADIDASFASGTLRGSKFTSTAYLMDENTIQVGPRVDFRIDETWSLSAAYTFETDLDETTTHSANVGLRARF